MKGLNQSGVGDITLKLVELARNEVAPLFGDGLVNLVDQSRFANAGVAGDQQQFDF